MARSETQGSSSSKIVILIAVVVLLVVGCAGASILAAIILPGLLSARVSANEVSAVGTLKSLATSEEQFRSQSIVDQDGDGTGEYGYIAELSGVAAPRGGGPAVDPNFVEEELGRTALSGGGIAEKGGYLFLVYLATDDVAVPEPIPLPPASADHANFQETRWAAYAWPASYGSSGIRAFFVNQEGQVYATDNADGRYDGRGQGPAARAAFDPDGPKPDNLEAATPSRAPAGDGAIWNPVGG